MNKDLLLVASIVSLITGILYCITLFLIPFGIANIIASSKLRDARSGLVSRETARNWSIYLIFTDLISGILGLIATTCDEDSSSIQNTVSPEERLKNLKSLYDSGNISQDEYTRRRKDIIDSL